MGTVPLGSAGQSSVEAAALLPLLMLLFALLAQPVCVLYTRTVMREAAAETARVLATAPTDDVARAYALRRLAAVPEASPFHVGGPSDWEVATSRSEDGRTVTVEIAGHLRPLPLLGVVASLMGEHDDVGLVVRVRLDERVRPDWMRGDYGQWMDAWQP